MDDTIIDLQTFRKERELPEPPQPEGTWILTAKDGKTVEVTAFMWERLTGHDGRPVYEFRTNGKVKYFVKASLLKEPPLLRRDRR